MAAEHGTLDTDSRTVAQLIAALRETNGYAECESQLWLDSFLYMIERRANEQEARLRQIVAMLTQPVQFTGSTTPAAAQILRADAAAAVKAARAALRQAGV